MTLDGYSPATSDTAPRGGWLAPVADGPLRATVVVPGSKSLTNRELILAAIADGPSVLHAPLHSDDSARMVRALTTLGVSVESVDDNGASADLRITPVAPFRGNVEIDCGQAGTVMRFVAGLAGFASGEVTITAHESALHRPMGSLIAALRDVGLDIDDGGHWALPFTVRGHGHVRGGEVEIDASASSQFVSGLLLAAPRFDVGLHLRHTGARLPSIPHIDMTIESLAHRGIHVERPAPGEWIVPPGPVRGKDIAIEPDLSNAAPFLAAAMVAGGQVTVPGWPLHSTQPGALLVEILAEMGAKVVRRSTNLTVTAGESIEGIDLDLSAAGELAPTLFGLAAFAESPTTLYGIGHIRGHESDRIAALVSNLQALGGEAHELEDGIRIVPRPLHGGTWRTYHDHRLATTGALIGLRVPGVRVDDIGTTAKTLPQFPSLWQGMREGAGR
ncbi:3-phosphoshikimate 1-carboxyvinyltransferase [Microbacterium sp. dk485]|uniref:3-phosphoshikimate 1-carboxyvinyltransferase n=1 Tax=Microbacterium sp. dk485 TaxID=2560021 RepID=UPI0010742B7E|nr:3-phosphoshikimate 1-carboxyvinyltransferase [Microbacterium sp. dk485]TFV83732.1 3-phosphoshikimate 1-carboxyvinyltransferase [Microbacterium sp. dk485]